MDYLKKIGISTETIKKITDKYDESVLELIDIEQHNVKQVIDYMEKIGIKNIEGLLLYSIEIFTKNIEEIKNIFEQDNQEWIVKTINEDITMIDRL